MSRRSSHPTSRPWARSPRRPTESLTEVSTLLESDKYTTADKHLSDWLDANCNGG